MSQPTAIRCSIIFQVVIRNISIGMYLYWLVCLPDVAADCVRVLRRVRVKFRSVNHLFLLRIFVGIFCLSWQMPLHYPKFCYSRFLSHPVDRTI
jgi:hypothetical protein